MPIGQPSDLTEVLADIASVYAETAEIERHIHNYERWFGPAAGASGENHIADPLGEVGGTPAGVVTSFRVTSGASNIWGTALQIWGATDCTLLPSGLQDYFDLHRMRATAAEVDKQNWFLRIIAGTSAAAGVTADTYSVLPMFVENTDKTIHPIDLLNDRVAAGTKVWVQLLYVDNTTEKYVDLQFGIHGYSA